MDIAWAIVGVVSALLVGVGVSVLGLSPPEYTVARVCFWFSAILLGGTGLYWVLKTDQPVWWRVTAGALIWVCVGVGLPETLRWVSRRESPRRVVGLQANYVAAELAEVNDFICKLNENELREEFDFPNMVKFNVEFAKRNLAPGLIPPDESAQIDAYFLNGNARIDMRYAKVYQVNNRAQVDWIPGNIGVINTSAKYAESRKKLSALVSSANLPDDVSASLRLFDDAIEKNSAVMIESLNNSLKSDPRNILENSVYGSNWYGSASGLYWKQFIPLRARADVVTLAVRAALQGNPAR